MRMNCDRKMDCSDTIIAADRRDHLELQINLLSENDNTKMLPGKVYNLAKPKMV